MPSTRGRIVVGVDGSQASAAAVRWAAQEAQLRHASMHLLFVHDNDRSGRAPYAGSSSAPARDKGNAAERAELAAAEQQASRALPPDRLSSELVDGSPAQVLIDQLAGAELLVLGTADLADESESERPADVGPVARACLHAAACPVVVVSPCDPSDGCATGHRPSRPAHRKGRNTSRSPSSAGRARGDGLSVGSGDAEKLLHPAGRGRGDANRSPIS